MKNKILWFVGGFSLGITALSLGHAAIPKKAAPAHAKTSISKSVPKAATINPSPMTNSMPVAHTARPNSSLAASPLSEIKGNKVTAPDVETDYSKLSRTEGHFAESWNQQQKLRAATIKGNQTRARQ